MKKLRRNQRIGALMNILVDRPNYVFTYNYFTEKFNSAKSTISEDIVIAKDLVEILNLGHVETISGASGGVKFLPKMSNNEIERFLNSLCDKFSEGNRIITGGFIYMADILYSPDIIKRIGRVFANRFINQSLDYIVTVETKGIPIAIMTAQALNIPLVIIRRNTKVTEGPTVSINYMSGSTRKIQTMSLSRRAMVEGARVLIIDDFMKAGGTAKGMMDMMKEFNAEVRGVGVLIATDEPQKKLIHEYVSLLKLVKVDETEGTVSIERNFCPVDE